MIIDVVAQAIPKYPMICFLLYSLIKDLESITTRLLSGNNNVENAKIRWVVWDRLKGSKLEGSLGLKYLRASNMAMLAKQDCCLVNNPSCLLSLVLKTK